MDEDNQKAELPRKLLKVALYISHIGFECSRQNFSHLGNECSRQYIDFLNLIGRLGRLFKGLEKIREQISEETVNALRLFEKPLDMVKNLAELVRCGCKLYMVLNREEINNEFENAAFHLRKALCDISYRKLNIPGGTKVEVGHVHEELGTLNEMFGAPNLNLYEDMSCVCNLSNDVDTDDGTLSKLCRKLHFWGVEDIKRESQVLKKVMDMKKVKNIPGDGNLEESEKKMLVLLEKLENFLVSRTVPDDFRCPISLELMRDPVITCTGKTYERAFIEKWLQEGHRKCPVTQETLSSTSLTSNCALQSLIRKWHHINGTESLENFGKSLSKLTFNKMEQEFGLGVPDEFVCCLSKIRRRGNCQKSTKLMKDPVIICTGETYERASIEKWLKAGHKRCPWTREDISSTSLTTNYALYSLISNWREVNGLKPFKRSSSSDQGMVVSTDHAEGAGLYILLSKLGSCKSEDRRSAAEELCYLARHNYSIVIPLLVDLLFSPCTDTQKYAIITLRELSLEVSDSRHCIMSSSSNAVPGILYVLENGSMEAREVAALTFWSLSTLNEYRETLGASGAIPALVKQLRDGSFQEKRASAHALSELCKYEGNQGLAISAGVVSMLLGEITVCSYSMEGKLLGRLRKSPCLILDPALDVMKLLVSHPDGKAAIKDCGPVPVLLLLLIIGSPRNKEIVLAILSRMQSHLALDDPRHPHAKELAQILLELNIDDDITSDKALLDFKTLVFPFI